MYISGHGDFQLSQVDAPVDPLSLNPTAPRPAKPGKGGDMDVQVGESGLSLKSLSLSNNVSR